MKTPEQRREDFYAFIDTLPKRVGETPESVIADYWLSQFEAYKEELRAEGKKLIKQTEEEIKLDQDEATYDRGAVAGIKKFLTIVGEGKQ